MKFSAPLRITTGLISVVLAVALLAVIFLTSAPGESWIKKYAENRLSQILSADVQIGQLQTNLFSRFAVKDLSIVNLEGDSTTLVKSDVRILYNLWQLLGSEPRVDSLIIVKLIVNLSRDSTGRFNFELLNKPGETDSSLSTGKASFSIGNLTCTGSTLHYNDENVPIELTLSEVTAIAQFTSDRLFSFSLASSKSTCQTIGQVLELVDLKIVGSKDADGLKMDFSSADTSPIQINGVFSNNSSSTSTKWQFKGHTTFDFANLATMATTQLPIKQGVFTCQFDMIQLDTALAISVDGSGRDLWYAGLGIYSANISSKISISSLTSTGKLVLTACDIGFDGQRVKFDTLYAMGSMNEEGLKITGLEGQTAGLKFSGNSLFTFPQQSNSLSESLIQGELIAISDFTKFNRAQRRIHLSEYFPTAGRNKLQLAFNGMTMSPAVTFATEFKNIKVANIEFPDGEIHGQASHDKLRIDTLHVNVSGGLVYGSGWIEMNDMIAHQANFKLAGVDFSEVWSDLYGEPSPYRAIVYGDIISRGDLRNVESLETIGNLEARDVYYQNVPLQDFQAKMAVSTEGFDLNLKQDDLMFSINGDLNASNTDLKFEASIPDLGYLTNLFKITGIEGAFHAKGTFSGEETGRNLHAYVTGGNVLFNGIPFDSLTGGIKWQNGDWELEEVQFRALNHELSELTELIPLNDVTGILSYSGTLSGMLNSPTGKAQLSIEKPVLRSVELERLTADISIQNNSLKFNKVELISDSLSVSGEGTFNLKKQTGEFIIGIASLEQHGELSAWLSINNDESMLVDLTGSGLPVSQLVKFYEPDTDWSGTADLTLEYSKAGDEYDIGLNLFVVNPMRDYRNLDSLLVKADFSDNMLNVKNMILYSDTSSSQLSFNLSLLPDSKGNPSMRPDSPIHGNATADGIDLAIFNRMFNLPMQLAGIATYNLTWSGIVADPKPSGKLELKNGSVRSMAYFPDLRDIQIGLNLSNREVSLSELSGVVADQQFSGSGKVSVKPGEGIDSDLLILFDNYGALGVQGLISTDSLNALLTVARLDLTTLSAFLQDTKVHSGMLNSRLQLTGSLIDPRVEGNLSISQVGLTSSLIDDTLQGGYCQLTLSNDLILIDTLGVRIGKGLIHGKGRLTLDSLKVASLNTTLNSQELQLIKLNKYAFTIEYANISVTDDEEDGYLIGGEIQMDKSRYFLNITPQRLLTPRRSNFHQTRGEKSIRDRTKINLRVSKTDDFWLDSNYGKARLEVETDVTGTLSQPNLTGRVIVREGYITYLDRKFNVATGVIDFFETDHVNPFLDLHLVAQLKSYQTLEETEYTIHMTIQGPADQPTIELYSDPPEDKSDILALLTTGAKRRTISGDNPYNDANVVDVLRNRLEGVSSRKVSNMLSERVGSALGLEQLSIERNLFDFDGSWNPQLVASKKLNKRVEITYTTTIGQLNDQGVSLEYKLTPNISIESQTNRSGENSADLKYHIRLK
ncbi:translocation/assembly module TamB domain-containing protein [Calditrichota bacterium]